MGSVVNIFTYRPGFKSFLMVLAVIFLIVALSPLAAAQPLEDARQDVDELQQKLESAIEKYNYACYKLGETKEKIADNSFALQQAEAELATAKSRLNNRARSLYMTRQSTMLDVFVNASSFDEFLLGLEYSKKLAANDAGLLKQVREAEANLRTAQQTLAEQKGQQETAAQELASSKEAVEKELTGAKGRLAGVEDQVRQAMETRANQPVDSSATRKRPKDPFTPGPPPGEPNTGVVGVAYNQLGDPYIYGHEGPDSFDCSGLVKYCYLHGAGISLPHSSYAQRSCGTPVSLSQLQPGDIVGFHGWGHVGIYVGGGQYIHAPNSGNVVRVSSLSSRGDYAGAVRP
ncbi:MAG: C40 family peptidase [Actinobacteria bacterium]|nr:C40 family peptidase [Actinomycetota bacterium]